MALDCPAAPHFKNVGACYSIRWKLKENAPRIALGSRSALAIVILGGFFFVLGVFHYKVCGWVRFQELRRGRTTTAKAVTIVMIVMSRLHGFAGLFLSKFINYTEDRPGFWSFGFHLLSKFEGFAIVWRSHPHACPLR